MGDESVFERVGGQPFFDSLVERFYLRVEVDEVLRPLYPDDLDDSKRHLARFLAQYWGGPPDYSAERGHPRLRLRHVPFEIGRAERDAWFEAMAAAVDESGLDDDDRRRMLEYFEMAANHLVNADRG